MSKYVKKYENQQQRFDDKYTIKQDGCWMWNKTDSTHRYGQMVFDGLKQQAHRVSYQLHIGPIPEDMNVLHDCDTPGCVNPDHLFTGTQKDNVDDMVKKGRAKFNHGNVRCGDNHYASKLREVDVRNIRAIIKYVPSANQTNVAKLYGVCRETVWNFCNGKTWKHVT